MPQQVPRPQCAPAVGARVAPDSIGIGDRFCLSIEVEKDQVQTVVFPEFSGDGSDGIELVESLPVDTLERRGRLVRLRKRYVLAAFEEGDFALGRARVLYADKNVVDTLRSDDSLFLHVATFAIDSASRSIYDVKPQKHLPFRLAEIRGYLVWGAAALVLLAAVAWVVLRLLSRSGRSVRTLFRPAPPCRPTWRRSGRSKRCTTASCGRTTSTSCTTRGFRTSCAPTSPRASASARWR